jgi:hypothetical protein
MVTHQHVVRYNLRSVPSLLPILKLLALPRNQVVASHTLCLIFFAYISLFSSELDCFPRSYPLDFLISLPGLQDRLLVRKSDFPTCSLVGCAKEPKSM